MTTTTSATGIPLPPAPRINSCQRWNTNGELIRDAIKGRVDLANDRCIDPTYELGLWWSEVRPTHLTTWHRDVDGSDFRDLPHGDGEFHHSFYDPPYNCIGGRATSTITEFNDRYGLDDAPRTPAELRQLINDGLTEQARITTKFIFAKNMNYVSNDELQPGVIHMFNHAMTLGLKLEDWFIMDGDPGAQPKKSTCCWCGHAIQLSSPARGRKWMRMVRRSGFNNEACDQSAGGHEPDGSNRQHHASQNASHLLIFKK